MKANCCFSCSPDPDDPCSIDPSQRPDVHRGDFSKIFERAIAEFPQYPAVVHSRDPWVVSFENLLTDEETDGVIEAVGGPGEQPIGTTAAVHYHGLSCSSRAAGGGLSDSVRGRGPGRGA